MRDGLPRSYDAWATRAPDDGRPYANHTATLVAYVPDSHGLCCDNCQDANLDAEGEVWVVPAKPWPKVYCSDECAGEAAYNDKVIRAYEAKADRERE